MKTLQPMGESQSERVPGPAGFQKSWPAPARTLEQAVRAAVDEVADAALQLGTPRSGGSGPFRAMLALMTFCYARQLYSSMDLSDIARRDVNCYWPEGGGPPGGLMIRRFRLENRPALHSCLITALRFLVEQKISLGLLTKVNEHQLAEEANRRITMAAFLDSVELDGEEVQDPPVDLCYLFANRSLRGH